MGQVLSGLHNSVVRIVHSAARRQQTLLGTGIVVSKTSVITCRHVIEPLRELHPDHGEKFSRASVLCGAVPCRSISARASGNLDLCVLNFSELPGLKPMAFMRAGRIGNAKLSAIGYKPRISDPRVLPELRVLQEEQSKDGLRLQSAQFAGGTPTGFSGAPVLAELETGWRVVGMFCLGGEESSISSMIATDPIAEFLAGEGIELWIDDSPPAVDPPLTQTNARVRVGRHVEDSTLEVTGDKSLLDVGHSIRRSAVSVRGVTPDKKK